jgi:hypothetical protein
MSQLDRIRDAFRVLGEVSFPDGYLQGVELAAINAHLDATRAGRAKHLLATRGRREAAAIMGCSETHIYKIARAAK